MPLTDYCEKACKRASECGFKRAKQLAVVGGSKDLEQVEGAERSLKEHYFECKRACAAKPVRDAERSVYDRAVACLSEQDCKAYEACLDSADREPSDAKPAQEEPDNE